MKKDNNNNNNNSNNKNKQLTEQSDTDKVFVVQVILYDIIKTNIIP